MQNKNISTALTARFQQIRDTVQKMQDDVIRVITKTADINARNVKRYSPEYLTERTAELTTDATAKIVTIKEIARTRADNEFTAIRSTLADWSQQPLPEGFASLLSAYTSYQISPTKRELETLIQASRGNYIAQRIVSQMATQAGLDMTDFRLYEDYERSLKLSQLDVYNAIDNYKGILGEGYKYVADELGLAAIAKNESFSVFAEDFLTRTDTSFAETERLLTTVTDLSLTMLPSKRQAIDDLFRDCTNDDQKRYIIKQYVAGNDFYMTDLLQLYDSKLYGAALQEIADERRASAEDAIRTRQEASRSVSEALRSVSEIDAIQNRTTA